MTGYYSLTNKLLIQCFVLVDKINSLIHKLWVYITIVKGVVVYINHYGT